ncbi:MAG: acyl-CoA dehydrogenase family protein, partial [Candidatus Margulisbacteria bacterium]|nr:acyl-CoA dehydrogenase family protein [Candidatus Margulisiibacteriota bacterium]
MKVTDNVEKQNAIDLAESSRETEWRQSSFVAELFKGKFMWKMIHPFPLQDPEDKKIGDDFLKEVENILKSHVDPDEVDRNQELPQSAINALAEKGLFGLKIDKKYGGLGLSITNYVRVMELVGSWCGTTAVWLSAHQSIGVPQPLKLFGTEDQKNKYLPRLAKGAISAFALTEPNVGSDTAQMSTTATLSEDGSHFLLNGDKLYITNGTAAELLVVMAVTPPKIVNGKEKKQ